MKYKEFLEYLESNLEGYNIFMRKARQFQGLQNAKRKRSGLTKKWKRLRMICGGCPWSLYITI